MRTLRGLRFAKFVCTLPLVASLVWATQDRISALQADQPSALLAAQYPTSTPPLPDCKYVLDVAAPVKAGNSLILVKSPDLRLEIADAASIQRKWGPQVKGIAVDLTLDKDTFELGEDVHLHIAAENFSATEPVLGLSQVSDPCCVKVELRDSCGLRIPPEGGAFWMGHGMPPVQYLEGEPVAIERTLSQMGFVPERPGMYTVVVSWRFYTGRRNESSGHWEIAPDSPYATPQSRPLTFRIVDSEHPERSIAQPRCVPTPSNFELVDTSFGSKTALKDKVTGLQWLHLKLTEKKGCTQLKQAMAAGGRFAGWRFATPNEVKQLFAHYVGSPDGVSTDPALAARFLDDMGGPLDAWTDQASVQHKSSRGMLDKPSYLGRATYGLISVSGPEGKDSIIDPKLEGSVRDGGVAYVGSYLVQETKKH